MREKCKNQDPIRTEGQKEVTAGYFYLLFIYVSNDIHIFQVGVSAWKTVQDANNQTPEDYARERCFDSYRQLVQKKLDQQHENPHVVIGIPEVISTGSTFGISGKAVVPPPRQYCNLCTRQVHHRTTLTRTFLYRPALLTMVGIAAVCVCVGILLHTPPKVRFVVPSFRWELVDFGAI